MPCHCATEPSQSYFVVMIDYGRKGREAVVDPELTRRAVIDRIRTREYWPINFIHYVHPSGGDLAGNLACIDVTNELLAEAGFYEMEPA
jgi:hypothetical protein